MHRCALPRARAHLQRRRHRRHLPHHHVQRVSCHLQQHALGAGGRLEAAQPAQHPGERCVARQCAQHDSSRRLHGAKSMHPPRSNVRLTTSKACRACVAKAQGGQPCIMHARPAHQSVMPTTAPWPDENERSTCSTAHATSRQPTRVSLASPPCAWRAWPPHTPPWLLWQCRQAQATSTCLTHSRRCLQRALHAESQAAVL